MATPEKALLDLVHLTPGGDSPDYVRELRLDFERLDHGLLDRIAAGHPKLVRAARRIREMAREEGYAPLCLERANIFRTISDVHAAGAKPRCSVRS